MNKIEILIDKTKLILGVAFTFLVVLASIWFFPKADEFAKTTVFFFFQNPLFNRILIIATILIFGWLTIYGTKKIFRNNTGLIIDDNGITDNSALLSVGLIKWNEITEIKTETYQNSKFLLVFVKEPNQFLENVKGLKRKMMQGNMNTYGTPLSISPNTLKYDFTALEKLLQERLNEHQNKTPNS